MLLDQTSKVLQQLKQVDYFNLELNPCKSTLIINASRTGIDSFLKLCSFSPLTSQVLRIKHLSRPQRKWTSAAIQELENHQVYWASQSIGKNTIAEELVIHYLNTDSSLIFFVEMQGQNPVLTINHKGWLQFLEILSYLRNKSFWFYVLKDFSPYEVPFRLTKPIGDPKRQLLNAIECIRLDPEDEIFLKIRTPALEERNQKMEDASDNSLYFQGYPRVLGNSAGLLLFSHWLHHFSLSPEQEIDIPNSWIQQPKQISSSNLNETTTQQKLDCLHFRKLQTQSSTPMLSFECIEESEDLYIFGNASGFEELSQIVEEYAFSSDHDEMFFVNSSPLRNRGELFPGVFGGKGFRSFQNWGIVGGALIYHLDYSSTGDYSPFKKLNKNF